MTRTLQAHSLGRRGENYAVKYLDSLGWTVVDRNWRCKLGELDIICVDDAATLVFVEVKTRAGLGFGSPLESITRNKLLTLRSLAGEWLQEHDVQARRIRIDAIGILKLPGLAPELEHVRGIEW